MSAVWLSHSCVLLTFIFQSPLNWFFHDQKRHQFYNINFIHLNLNSIFLDGFLVFRNSWQQIITSKISTTKLFGKKEVENSQSVLSYKSWINKLKSKYGRKRRKHKRRRRKRKIKMKLSGTQKKKLRAFTCTRVNCVFWEVDKAKDFIQLWLVYRKYTIFFSFCAKLLFPPKHNSSQVYIIRRAGELSSYIQLMRIYNSHAALGNSSWKSSEKF